MKIKISFVAFLLIGALGVGIVNADDPHDMIIPMIKISPSTLILSAPTQCVTVHTNIPCSLVDGSTLELSGVSPYLVKSDNRGNIVGKFHGEDVKAIVDPGPVVLDLTGVLIDGTPFTAYDVIVVKE